MKNLYTHLVLLVALVAIVLHFVPMQQVEKKVAFVKSQDLIYGYLGTKDIQNKFNLQLQVYQSKLDTLKNDYQRSLSMYQKDLSGLNDTEKKQREALLTHQENNIRQYQAEVEAKIQEEEAHLMTGVLNQINAYVEVYAQEHGITLVLGTTQQGNILYGEEAMDITEDLLKALNEQY